MSLAFKHNQLRSVNKCNGNNDNNNIDNNNHNHNNNNNNEAFISDEYTLFN